MKKPDCVCGHAKEEHRGKFDAKTCFDMKHTYLSCHEDCVCTGFIAITQINRIDSDQERREIYNALCCLNVSIRAKQPKRAKYVQKLIQKFSHF